MKKLICTLLAALLFILASLTALAAEYSEGYFHYTISDESITITDYFGDEETVTVPALIAGIPVNSIASGAFAGSGIKVLNLPDTITSIEGGAIDIGVVINYNSNLPPAEQEQPNPPVQPNPQPDIPAQPNNIPGQSPALPPTPPQDSDTDDVALPEQPDSDDVTLPDETEHPDSDDVTLPAETEQPKPSARPNDNDAAEPKPTDKAPSEPDPAANNPPDSSQDAVEEVEIELKEEDFANTPAVTQPTPDGAASPENAAQANQSAPASSEGDDSDSLPYPAIALMAISVIIIIAIIVILFVLTKKKK